MSNEGLTNPGIETRNVYWWVSNAGLSFQCGAIPVDPFGRRNAVDCYSAEGVSWRVERYSAGNYCLAARVISINFTE